jgi:hypothetical protein
VPVRRDKQARDAYVDVGKHQRAAHARAHDAGLIPKRSRWVIALDDLLSSYSRHWDYLYVAQVAAHAYGVERAKPWQIKHTREALHELADAGVIYREASTAGAKAAWKIGLVAPDEGSTNQRQVDPQPGSTVTPQQGSQVDPQPGGPTEEYPRKEAERAKAPTPAPAEAGAERLLSKPTPAYVAELAGKIALLSNKYVTDDEDDEFDACTGYDDRDYVDSETVDIAVELAVRSGARFAFPSEASKIIEATMRQMINATRQGKRCPARCLGGWNLEGGDRRQEIRRCPECDRGNYPAGLPYEAAQTVAFSLSIAEEQASTRTEAVSVESFAVGDCVSHAKWGRGSISGIENEGDATEATVSFDDGNEKHLLLARSPLEKVADDGRCRCSKLHGRPIAHTAGIAGCQFEMMS